MRIFNRLSFDAFCLLQSRLIELIFHCRLSSFGSSSSCPSIREVLHSSGAPPKKVREVCNDPCCECSLPCPSILGVLNSSGAPPKKVRDVLDERWWTYTRSASFEEDETRRKPGFEPRSHSFRERVLAVAPPKLVLKNTIVGDATKAVFSRYDHSVGTKFDRMIANSPKKGLYPERNVHV
ncbi:hypothetical protein KIN20_031174 [Parelaphostrongylus tenuis]|uniref:Uncharacterized protein n=1 Tax=Parelaphostrongylus tenuis TaxID=148309 RepID=A0AAD5R561_PARTN|nr:hypothetical protein KIN20_031174 [Parelaphostrongylus tenuis]